MLKSDARAEGEVTPVLWCDDAHMFFLPDSW